MPLEGPKIDPRNYPDILQDALARIPVHNPEWTNFNDSDPGVTMIQLFAFMTESIVYRANLIPERSRMKFLKLLGIPLRPAAAATGFVTINNERGPLEVKTFPDGIDVRAGQVRFRTLQSLSVLPIEARIFYKQEVPTTTDADRQRAQLYTDLYADLLGEGDTSPKFYDTVAMPQPDASGVLPEVDLSETVDGCLWIALLARKGESTDDVRAIIANQYLTLGIMPRMDDEGMVLEPGQINRSAPGAVISWEIASVPADFSAKYVSLPARTETSLLTTPSLVELALPPADKLQNWDWSLLEPGLQGTGEYPPSLADSNISDRVITWLRLRLDAGAEVKAQFSWIGINATMVQQRVIVEGELVGTGTGEPDQVVVLANTPVLPESLTLSVDGVPWYQVDDLLAADPEVPVHDPRRPLYRSEARIADGAAFRSTVYTVDPESGEVRFGDGAHGMRPRAGARITASYAFGGGRQGNVGVGSINRSPQLPASYKINNPLRTWGGDDAEDVTSAEKTIPRTVQHRDRLVSQQDFADITRRTPGVDLGRVEIIPLHDPNNPALPEVPGVVTVMVIPASDMLDNPKPDQFFLETVCTYLMPRRLVTTELHVRGPEYVDIWVSVGIAVRGGYGSGAVCEAVRTELLRFVSPLYGSWTQEGWPLNVPVLPQELSVVVARVDGVRLVNNLLLGSVTTNGVSSVPLTSLCLPRIAGIIVRDGDPIPLDQLKNAPSTIPSDDAWTPIPVLPGKC